MLNSILSAVHSYDHSGGHGVLEEAWAIFTDPGHFLAEIGFTLIIDFVVLFLGYQLLVKRVVIPRLRRQIHRELDAELKIDHEDGEGHGKRGS